MDYRQKPSWQHATVASLLKKDKAADERKSYRPVSLTSQLCKLAEQMIHARLIWWLERENCWTDIKWHTGQTIQLVAFTQPIIDGFQQKPPESTIGLFIDMTAAFDKVWRQRLITKLRHLGIRSIIYIGISININTIYEYTDDIALR